MREGNPVLREQTKHFIDDNPTDVVLKRSVWADDGAGGTTAGPPTNLTAQTVRLVPQSLTEARTISGEVVQIVYVMVAEHDADILPDDTFTHEGMKFAITIVQNVGDYEKRAEVRRRV
jgi:hypothetical protein